MFRIRINFSKGGDMSYISHLDMVRVLSRALRRAKLPFFLTQGFSPRPKISFKNALALGKSSDNEECVISLTEKVSKDKIIQKLNLELPEGIKIYDAFYEEEKEKRG